MIDKAILLYATVDRLNQLEGWALGLMTALLTLRAINDFMSVYCNSDIEMGVKEAFAKCKKRIYAVVIAITIDSLVFYFKMFY